MPAFTIILAQVLQGWHVTYIVASLQATPIIAALQEGVLFGVKRAHTVTRHETPDGPLVVWSLDGTMRQTHRSAVVSSCENAPVANDHGRQPDRRGHVALVETSFAMSMK